MIDYASSGSRSLSRERVDVVGFLRRLDWVLLLAVGALVAYGLWAIAGITRHDVLGNESYYVVRQAIAAGLGFAGFVVALLIDPDRYRRAQKGIYAVTLLLMLLVFPFADTTRGSKRWIDLGPFQFQPSEFGKLLFVLALAGFLAERARRLHEPQVVLQAIGLALVPILLVFKQPDLGTALVYTAALAACLFVAGIRWSHLVVLASVGALVIASVVWFLPGAGIEVLEPYQTARLTGFTNPDSDPAGTTYNVTQSITAVGAGGLTGRGVEGAKPDAPRLPARARHRLRLRVVRRAARLLRRLDPAAALPARRLARSACDRSRARRVQRDRGGWDRVRVSLPGVRQRRHDDGDRAGDRHPAPVRHRRRLVDGREPARDRRAPVDPRARSPESPTSALRWPRS